MADVFFRPDGQNRFQIRSAANGTLPSAWLDQELNAVYSHLNAIESGGTTIGTEWAVTAGTYTYVSDVSFSVLGDLSAIFETGRAIRFTDSDDVNTLSHIRTSTYVGGTNTTTITVYDPVVPQDISSVSVGLISSEASSIPSVTYTTRSSAYLVSDKDQIIFADDTNTSSLSLVYDDNQVNGEGYYALRITLPDASYLPGKLLCIKKIAGNHVTIVSSTFTHTTQTDGTDVTHINTYNFQIYGDASAKNRVTLSGVGDCYWLVSNGSRWYELTPEASENVKGIVKLATDEEMSLSAEQIAASEELSRTLAVSPYQVDKNFLRTDASNMRFASKYIYKSPNGVAGIQNNQILVYQGLGINIPNGREDDGSLKNIQVELDEQLSYAAAEVSGAYKVLFITATKQFDWCLHRNFFQGYRRPTNFDARTSTGQPIVWFDWGTNTMKKSTNLGANWTTVQMCPVCQYYGNGTVTTTIFPYNNVGFLTRDDFDELLDEGLRKVKPKWSGATQLFSHSANGWDSYTYTASDNGYVYVYASTINDNSAFQILVNGTIYQWGGREGSYNTRTCGSIFVGAGQTYQVRARQYVIARWVPCY